MRPFGAVTAVLSALGVMCRDGGLEKVTDATVELFAAIDQCPLPVCLHIEDAQWLDAASEEAFLTFARQGHHTRVLVLVESQPRPMGLASRLHRLASSIDGGALVQLEPLSAEAVRDFFISRLGAAPDTAAARRLVTVTGGMPVYLDSIVRRLTTRNRSARSLDSAVESILTSRHRDGDIAAVEVREELADAPEPTRWALLLTALTGSSQMRV